ncbi:GNAT family N-acetyltransferase [Terasakiella sp.]|uniref:GNAT family N-acetyltransferase n=1 Tax=Terasakiella sp. TaxID=2034861 RepID=UPI003AA7DBBD
MFKFQTITTKETYNIRHRVLWPDEPIEYCMMTEDDTAHHFGGYIDQKLVCVASLFPDGEMKVRLRKFAILPHMQKKGLGSKMLKEIQTFLSETKISTLWCDAREAALPFYIKNGFLPYDDVFYKNGIPYQKAEYKVLPEAP